jgi:hypothetical protein
VTGLQRTTPLVRKTPLKTRKITPEQRRAWNDPPPPNRKRAKKTPGVRAIVRRRSQGVCERCRAAEATQFHHRKMRSQGGPDTEINLAHLCWSCHHWAHHAGEEAYESGWLVRSYEEP